MTTPLSLADLMREELRRLDWSQKTFRVALAAKGVDVGKSTVASWLQEESPTIPETSKLGGIFDTLQIHGDRRLAAYELAARPRQGDGNESDDSSTAGG